MPASQRQPDRRALFQELWPETLASAGSGRLRATGPCMSPAITPGDQVLVETVAPAGYRIGDVVVYRGESSLVAHRIVGAFSARDGAFLVHRGDNSAVRGVIPLDDALGRVAAIVGPDGEERPVSSTPPSLFARTYYSRVAALRHALHRIRALLSPS